MSELQAEGGRSRKDDDASCNGEGTAAGSVSMGRPDLNADCKQGDPAHADGSNRARRSSA